jgi:hypothetical protein
MSINPQPARNGRFFFARCRSKETSLKSCSLCSRFNFNGLMCPLLQKLRKVIIKHTLGICTIILRPILRKILIPMHYQRQLLNCGAGILQLHTEG